MRLTYLALMLLAGCANTGNPDLHTPSALYSTHFVGPQPSQADVDACVEPAVREFWIAHDSSRSKMAGAIAGNAYEACMLARGFRIR